MKTMLDKRLPNKSLAAIPAGPAQRGTLLWNRPAERVFSSRETGIVLSVQQANSIRLEQIRFASFSQGL
jgi:hypothetical protein